MSKSLQSEHGDSSSQSTIGAVTPGDKSVAFDAHGWEAFVGPCLSQTQHGRFAHQEQQASTEFSDPRDETPNIRMQDGEFFVTEIGSPRPIRLCRASLERRLRWRLRLPSSTASASEKDRSPMTGKEVGGGGSWNRRV